MDDSDSDSDGEPKTKKLDDSDSDQEEKEVIEANQPQATSLIDLPDQKSTMPQEEEKEAIPVKKGGFGLKAPPKNTQHVIENVRNLNKKLMDEPENKVTSNGNAGDVMDMLMDIDFGNNQN